MQSLPYIDRKRKLSVPLLIVAPINPVDIQTEDGLYIPQGAGEEFQRGIVQGAGKGSSFKNGDLVSYKLIDRTRPDNFEEFKLDGKNYDIIGESEVWDVNDEPYGRVFVRPLSAFDVAMDGLVFSEKAQGITQKGIIVAAPKNYFCKPGDTIEYRPNEKGIYREVTINRNVCHVIFEQDIYLINGAVSPHRVIVKIDMAAQRLKRSATDSGMALSPMFIGMMYNLQVGEVHAIGDEAKQFYPEMKVGDTVIFHHKVESKAHCLLSREAGKLAKVLYEYRMIECFNPEAREIFARIDDIGDIVPFGKSVFCDWNFELFEKDTTTLLETELSLEKCTDIEDLKNTIHHKTEEATKNFKSKFAGYSADMDLFAYDSPDDKEKIELTGRKIDQLKTDALRMARFTKKNYLLKLNVLFSGPIDSQYTEIVATYKELYPINILGRKYLIAHADFITAYLNNDTNMSTLNRIIPIADQVLVKPISEEDKSGLIVAEDAMEKPQSGVAMAVGRDVNPEEIQVGWNVSYRKRTGMETTIDGEVYLMLRRNTDIFYSLPPEAENTTS